MAPSSPQARAIALLESVDYFSEKYDTYMVVSRVLGLLRGYALPEEVLQSYFCKTCDIEGVKLWRGIHSSCEGWCAKCACAQAGLPDDIDEEGRRMGTYGTSDQIYSPLKGLSLLPWVPAPDGGTWGYTSVPPEGVEWWRALPTRLA